MQRRRGKEDGMFELLFVVVAATLLLIGARSPRPVPVPIRTKKK